MRFSFTLLFALAAGVLASQEKFCHTTEALEAWFASHPAHRATFEALQRQAAENDKAHFVNGYGQQGASRSMAATSFTIPVVFHILHQGGSENISDAQVKNAVSILTRDFNRLNADTTNVVQQFKSKIGDTKVTFVLATRDPAGNCTNGILRHWDPKTEWEGDHQDYKYSWPSNMYLNIYVVKSMGFGAAAYTFLPGSGIPDEMDAIVAMSHYIGNIGTGTEQRSRVLTHEVGHWLNLEHTWGWTNSPGVSCGDDGVSDTPETMGFTACALSNAIVCNPGIVENVQNYMEYSYCDNMFTTGQSFRMQTALNSSISGRDNLSQPANLLATGITNPLSNCVPRVDIMAAPSRTVCAGKAIALTSFTWNADPVNYLWTAGSDASITAASSGSTSIAFSSAGTKTVSLQVSNQFGNDNETMVIVVKDAVTELPLGGSESFEGSSLPQFWNNVNPGGGNVVWKITPDASSHGVNSVFLEGEKLPPNAVRILEGPSYDFKNNQGGLFTFKYAYARASAANKDVFRVQASTDCGGTWRDIYYPGNGQMASGSGEIDNTPFVPPAEAWKLYNLSAHPNFKLFRNEAHVRIRFYFQEDPNGSGYGNRIYLDEINFSTPTGVNELSKRVGLQMYPNPASEKVTLDFTLSDRSTVKCVLHSVTGSEVLRLQEQELGPGSHSLQIETAGLAPGLYFVNTELDGTVLSRKLLVE